MAPSSWQAVQSGPVRTSKLRPNLGADLAAGEVEDLIQGDVVAVELPGEQSFDPDRLAGTETA